MMNALTKTLLLSTVLLIAACGEKHSDIRAWVDQQRKTTPTNVPKAPKPELFEPTPYTLVGQLDPFDGAKLKAAIAKAKAASGATLAPDLNRRREALEAMPLDALKYVGYVNNKKLPYALIQAQSGLYQVTIGNYIGSDFGRIITLGEREIVLKELVQDGSGEWSERVTKLGLTEAAKDAGKEQRK